MKIALIGLALSALLQPTGADLKSHDVTFTTSDGETLGGRIFEPASATGKLPAMLLVHGSGKGNSWQELQVEAEAFARQGIAVLAPDKRSGGYSSTKRDFSQLADDALKAFAVLRQQPEVDPAKTGIWGISEGGWVAPIIASRSSDVKFMVTVGGPGYGALRTQAWNMANKLNRAEVKGSVVGALDRQFFRLVGDAGLFPEAYRDPSATLSQVKQPVLALWGKEDNQVMAAESAQVFKRSLTGSLTVKFFPSGHSLGTEGVLVKGYPEAVGSWVRDVTSGDVPASSAEPLPVQETASRDLPRSAWWESWQVQIGLMLAMTLAFAGYLVTGRGKVRSWPARILAVCGLLAVPGFLVSMVRMNGATDGSGIHLGPLLAGRPIDWIVLQVLAFVTLISGVVLATRWRSTTVRQRVLLGASVPFVAWALYWGLLIP
ncbi:alpha/beta hydrolase family protein [Nonomuraea sp. NPDC050556]|uniref:alpha/beta hydrolase family protein n=1 Tax=Nonomuraea sp. NPDC050556 TaxID=3364369 RepID=UPI0037B50370